MKRLTILILVLLCVQLFSVGAYDVNVDSASQQKIVLAISNLNTVDIKVENVVATVETESLSDTYTVDATLSTQGDEVLITVDVSPLFEDYSPEEVKAITVSGMINVEGKSIEFGKRVAYRSSSPTQSSAKQFAPSLPSTNTNVIYWIVGLSLVLVLLILILFYRKPKTKSAAKGKRKSAKKKSVKKKARKKAKKRL